MFDFLEQGIIQEFKIEKIKGIGYSSGVTYYSYIASDICYDAGEVYEVEDPNQYLYLLIAMNMR